MCAFMHLHPTSKLRGYARAHVAMGDDSHKYKVSRANYGCTHTEIRSPPPAPSRASALTLSHLARCATYLEETF